MQSHSICHTFTCHFSSLCLKSSQLNPIVAVQNNKNNECSIAQWAERQVSYHNGERPKLPETKLPKTGTATGRNGHKPQNWNVHRPFDIRWMASSIHWFWWVRWTKWCALRGQNCETVLCHLKLRLCIKYCHTQIITHTILKGKTIRVKCNGPRYRKWVFHVIYRKCWRQEIQPTVKSLV